MLGHICKGRMLRGVRALPSGTVTFMFTDLEGSSRLWDQHAEIMRDALARHDAVSRAVIESEGGVVVKHLGDGLFAAFADASAAVRAAIALQATLAAEVFDVIGALRVRVGLHTGHAELRDDDYFGPVLNRAARLMACAAGGQTLCTSVTATLVVDELPSDAKLIDLGEHVLRDLSQPERVFQVSAPGLESEFPPLRSVVPVRSSLPATSTPFVGRADARGDVTQLLRARRVVCVTGVGGVGKTRLAIEVASELVGDFDDGTWFCDLSPVEDAELVVEVVAGVLGVRPRAGVDATDAVVDFLRARQVLLVLDNCEQVLDAVAGLVVRIVADAPRVRVLATSREGLHVVGEQLFALRPLPTDAGDGELSEAEELFLGRAEAAGVTAATLASDANRAAVREICRRLDGIPLAIELAAARLVAMNPVDIAARLDERFRLLTSKRRGALERHQTLRATIAWSYLLLDELEQLVFARLGVFSASFDLDAAIAVAGDDSVAMWEIVDVVESLVAKSMVVAEPRSTTTRYVMLETLRQFAREQLAERDELESCLAAHARHFATFAEEAGPQILGRDERAWQQRVAEEIDNLRAATTWSTDDPQHPGAALRIVAALANECTMGRATGIGGWAEQLLGHVDRATPGQRAAIVGAAAWRAIDLGDFARARELAEPVRDDAGAPDNPAPTLVPAALAFAAAIDHAEDAVAICEAARERLSTRPGERDVHLASMQAMLLMCRLLRGDALDAMEHDAALGLEAARRARTATMEAVMHSTFGNVCLMHGELERAMEHLEASIELVERGASDVMYATSLRCAARGASQLGDVVAAASYTRDAIAHAERSGDRRSVYEALDEATVVFADAGLAQEAIEAGAHCQGAGLGFAAFGTVRDDAVARAVSTLDDATVRGAQERGRTRSLDDAVASALAALDSLAAARSANHPEAAP